MKRITQIILTLIIFQDILAIFVTNMPIPNKFLWGRYVIVIKELICYIYFACYIISYIRGTIKAVFIDKLVLLYCLYVMFYLLIPSSLLGGPNVPLQEMIISARMLLFPVILFSVGRFLINNRNDCIDIFHYYFKVCIVSIAVGTILCLLPNHFWHSLGIDNLYKVKYGEDNFELFTYILNDQGMPLNFYVTDYYTDFEPIRRFSSTIIDPISSGILIAGLVIFSRVFQKFDNNIFRTIFFIISTAISISKGAIFVAIIGYLFISRKHRWIFMAFAVIIYALIITLAARFEVSNIQVRGPALISTFAYMKKASLGQGLGTSGFLSVMNLGEDPLKDEELSAFSGESYLGTMCIQLGIGGGVVFITFMIGLIAVSYRLYKLLKNHDEFLSQMSLGAAALSIGLLLISIISASGFGFVGVGTSFLMIGIITQCSLNSPFTIKRELIEY